MDGRRTDENEARLSSETLRGVLCGSSPKALLRSAPDDYAFRGIGLLLSQARDEEDPKKILGCVEEIRLVLALRSRWYRAFDENGRERGSEDGRTICCCTETVEVSTCIFKRGVVCLVALLLFA